MHALVEVVPPSVRAVGRADDPRDEDRGGSCDEPARLDRDLQVPRRGRELLTNAAGEFGERRHGLVVGDRESAAEVEHLELDPMALLEFADERERPADRALPRCRRDGLASDVEGEPGHAKADLQAVGDECRGILGPNAETRRPVAFRREREPNEYGDLGQFAELCDLGFAVDDEGADAPQVRPRDVGDRRDRVVVQASRDRDAGALEEVDLAPRGDREARPERVDRRDRGEVGECAGREVDGDVRKLVAQGEQLRGHAVGVEHEQRAAMAAHQAVEVDAVRVVGEVATGELAVRCAIGSRRGCRPVPQSRRDAARTVDEDIGEVHRRRACAGDARGIAAQHVHERGGGGRVRHPWDPPK